MGGKVLGYNLEDSPLFTTSLQLSVPVVICNPALADIQTAVNTAAKKVRGKGSFLWDCQPVILLTGLTGVQWPD